MTLEISRFYQEIQRNRRKLTAELEAGSHPGQPAAIEIVDQETGETRRNFPFIWAASLRNLNCLTTEARASEGKGICMITFELFVTRFTEGSHTFASPEQIGEYQEYRKRQKAFYDSEDLKSGQKFQVELPGAPK